MFGGGGWKEQSDTQGNTTMPRPESFWGEAGCAENHHGCLEHSWGQLSNVPLSHFLSFLAHWLFLFPLFLEALCAVSIRGNLSTIKTQVRCSTKPVLSLQRYRSPDIRQHSLHVHA